MPCVNCSVNWVSLRMGLCTLETYMLKVTSVARSISFFMISQLPTQMTDRLIRFIKNSVPEKKPAITL